MIEYIVGNSKSLVEYTNGELFGSKVVINMHLILGNLMRSYLPYKFDKYFRSKTLEIISKLVRAGLSPVLVFSHPVESTISIPALLEYNPNCIRNFELDIVFAKCTELTESLGIPLVYDDDPQAFCEMLIRSNQVDYQYTHEFITSLNNSGPIIYRTMSKCINVFFPEIYAEELCLTTDELRKRYDISLRNIPIKYISTELKLPTNKELPTLCSLIKRLIHQPIR